jgi:hypothetical protein
LQEKSVYDDSYGNKQAARVQGSAASFCRRDEFDLWKINYQVIARTTPPSARSAVPLIAEDSGLARKITKEATSSVLAKRLSNELAGC